MTYNFLFISIITLIPALIIYILRSDLRRVIHIMSLASIPFAFTEWLFYPDYWEPVFLFNLVAHIGFGIEDVIFVMGLGAFSSTLYPAILSKRYQPVEPISLAQLGKRILSVFSIIISLVAVFFSLGTPMIYGSVIIMLWVGLGLFYLRSDLILPGLLGGLLTLMVYTILCYIILLVYPQIFDLTWHTEQFLNIFVFGIPLEEILYAFSAGLLATMAYPFVFKTKFIPQPEE